MPPINIIQSCFHIADKLTPFNIKTNFLSPEFYWMSWALSALQLSKLYGEVTLYTNPEGKEFLIDQLRLPYTKVVVRENEDYGKLWALNKVQTYAAQNEPFIHIDGDVFLWQKFNERFLASELISQNIESNDAFYRIMLDELLENGAILPDMLNDIGSSEVLKSCNAGLLGGNDLNFIREYCKVVFDFVDINSDKLTTLKKNDINMFFEQLFFYQLAKKKNKTINCIIPSEIEDMSYPGIVNFQDVPHRTKFIHLLGNYKQSVESCKMLAKRLRTDFPGQYYHLINKLKKSKVDFYLNIYNSAGDEQVKYSDTLINWKMVYEMEKNQQSYYDQTFFNINTFLGTYFKVGELVKSINNWEEDCEEISVPCSLQARLQTITLDEIDKLMIQLLENGCTAAELLNSIKENLDTNVDTDYEKTLLELVHLKIRRGCEDNLYEILPSAPQVKLHN